MRALSLLLLACAACGSSAADDAKKHCLGADVIYEAQANDEACVDFALAKARMVTDDDRGAKLVAPSSAVSRNATGLTLMWSSSIDMDGDSASRASHSKSAWAWVSALNPISTAWAHGAGVNGAAHRVRLTGVMNHPNGVELYTSLLHWELDPVLAGEVLSSDGPVHVEITSAVFASGELPADGALYQRSTSGEIQLQ